jgi:hypothetical protein
VSHRNNSPPLAPPCLPRLGRYHTTIRCSSPATASSVFEGCFVVTAAGGGGGNRGGVLASPRLR